MDEHEYNVRMRIARELEAQGQPRAAELVRPQGPNGSKHISSASKQKNKRILLIWSDGSGWQCTVGEWFSERRKWSSEEEPEWWMELPWA